MDCERYRRQWLDCERYGRQFKECDRYGGLLILSVPFVAIALGDRK
jgi:hypothetical protein